MGHMHIRAAYRMVGADLLIRKEGIATKLKLLHDELDELNMSMRQILIEDALTKIAQGMDAEDAQKLAMEVLNASAPSQDEKRSADE